MIASKGLYVGPAAWVVQTYLHLSARGLDCNLTGDIPSSGIVLAHHDDFPPESDIPASTYWVCAQADRTTVQPYADFLILQNPTQRAISLQPYTYLPHWPQPGLIPRDSRRGDEFRNATFFGELQNIHEGLKTPTFTQWCNNNNIHFDIAPRSRWHDYSTSDAVIALRPSDKGWSSEKPPTKLINAWIAGVPAILGLESAFRSEGRVGTDYLEVHTISDLCSALLLLRANPQLRQKIAAAGTLQAQRFNASSIADRWLNLLVHGVFPRAESKWGAFRKRSLAGIQIRRLRAALAWRYGLLYSSFRP